MCKSPNCESVKRQSKLPAKLKPTKALAMLPDFLNREGNPISNKNENNGNSQLSAIETAVMAPCWRYVLSSVKISLALLS